MARIRKRVTTRQNWDSDSMSNAVLAVINKSQTYREASATFNVPRSTLLRKVKKLSKDAKYDPASKNSLGPIPTVFTIAEEKELVSYLQLMEGRLFGFSTVDCRKLAYQLAVKNNKKHNFSHIKEEAGYDWYKGFMSRHPELSLRKPEATSAARAMGFNKPVVMQFFKLLGELMDRYKFTPDRIYNCDETGISSVPKSKAKIIATKGRKQVGSITSAERGETVTVEMCMNSVGRYMPPLFIFPRQRHNMDFMRNAPPGSYVEFHPSGWMQKSIFERWLQNFITFSNSSKDTPVLLLLDGHSTHTKNIELINLARDNGVILLCFPPHCTHRLQPLDVGLMKPLSVYYDKEITNWLRSHPGEVVNLKHVAEIFGLAFAKAATMTTAMNSFKSTGIFPFNPDIFQDSDFVASDTTNVEPMKTIEVSQDKELENILNLKTVVSPIQISNPTQTNNIMCTEEIEGGQSNLISPITPVTKKNTSFPHVSPIDVIPIPQQSYENKQKKKRNTRAKGKTAILTDSPYKNELQQQQLNQTIKLIKKEKSVNR
ncbi:uncharacterized protein LOC111030774, partial [Myzus persicae]|uniref:uncharacterized protein LOC111030774 n=2 Tax=Myzus persicae TaxID=13164 RepID=UPI000B934F53